MKQLLSRHIERIARDTLDFMPGLIIEGARQVGKSTLAQQLANGDAFYVNLDDPQVRTAAEEDSAGFIAQAGERRLIIDEIQRMPELTLVIKAAIDRDRRSGRFILTGSSSLLRVRGLADSLAGRVGRLLLYGFSQGELAGKVDDFATAIKGASTQEILSHTTTLGRSDYAQLVVEGAYPAIADESVQRRQRWLDSYLQGLVGRDIPELRRVFDPGRAMSLLRLIAANQAGELVRARLANEAGIPATTISAYLDLLADTWLIATVPSWTPNLSRRETARPKNIIIDSGLATRLARLSAPHLAGHNYSQAFGALLEGFVVSELLRQQTWTTSGFELFHYRDRAGAEVDLILELDGAQIIAIEIKAATTFQTSQFKHLKALRDKLGDQLIAGIVLNTGTTGFRFSDRLYGLPVSALWEFPSPDPKQTTGTAQAESLTS